MSDNKPYKCLEEGCNASYAKPFKLEIHRRKHSGERPFICDILECSKAYTNPAHLKRHKCLVHEQSSEIMCTVKGCGLVLNNKYSLKKHYNRKHNTAIYAFTCSQCSQGFQRKRQLIRHIYFHSGDIPFKCSICNIGYKDLHEYNKHKRNHKTYTCDCKATFDRWSLFCEHRKNSCNIKKIDHKCIICNKVFTTKTNLTIHSMVHLEESQRDIYRCPYIDCKRSYQYKKNLNYHITAFHEKLRDEQIKCSEPGCERILKSKKNLKQHILKVHSNLPNKKKRRKPRKDKGKSKKCMASVMSGIQLPLEEHITMINNNLDVLSENALVHDRTIINNTNNVIVDKKINKQKEIVLLDNCNAIRGQPQLNDKFSSEDNSSNKSEDYLENELDSCVSRPMKNLADKLILGHERLASVHEKTLIDNTNNVNVDKKIQKEIVTRLDNNCNCIRGQQQLSNKFSSEDNSSNESEDYLQKEWDSCGNPPMKNLADKLFLDHEKLKQKFVAILVAF